MSDQNLQNFIGLSAVLTGLSAKLLAPSVDPINLPPVFFATAQQGIDRPIPPHGLQPVPLRILG